MPVVTNTVKYPDGTVAAGRVTIDLVGENGRPLTDWAGPAGSDYEVHGEYAAELALGVWSVTLAANSLITPSGTAYRVQENVNGKPRKYFIEVPDGAGPYRVDDPGIIVDPPGSIASAALSTHIDLTEGGVWYLDAMGGGDDDENMALALAAWVASDVGGTIILPARTDLTFADAWTTEYDDAECKYLEIRGAGLAGQGRVGLPTSRTALDFTYNGANPAKMLFRHIGTVELYGFVVKDSSGSSKPFVMTTNTTPIIQYVMFQGSKSTSTCDQDAILYGGTDTVVGNGTNAPVQGYGGLIHQCWFHKIRRGVHLRTYGNALRVTNNSFTTSCGHATGAAIELTGLAGSPCTGNHIAANLIEMPGYMYGVKAQYAESNFFHNDMYDPGSGPFLAAYRMESNAYYNLLMTGSNPTPFIDDQTTGARNTYINNHQSESSRFSEPVVFANNVDMNNLLQFASNVNATIQSQGTGDLALSAGSGAGSDIFLKVRNGAGALVNRARFIGNSNIEFYDTSGNLLFAVAGSTQGLGFYGSATATKQTVTGSRGGNAALASLLTALATIGLITDSSSA